MLAPTTLPAHEDHHDVSPTTSPAHEDHRDVYTVEDCIVAKISSKCAQLLFIAFACAIEPFMGM